MHVFNTCIGEQFHCGVENTDSHFLNILVLQLVYMQIRAP